MAVEADKKAKIEQPGAMPRDIDPQVMALMRKFGKAFNASDADGIMECVTDDFEWVQATGPDAPHGKIVKGKSELARALAERGREFSEMRFSETDIYAAGSCVVGTFRARGFYASGEALDVRGCDLYLIRDGLIARKDSYWKQIG